MGGTRNNTHPEALCLVPSNQGGPQAGQLVLLAGKVISSWRITGARDVAGSKLDVLYAV